MTTTRSVLTPQGEARLHTDRSRNPVATLLLGHGAGGGPEAADLAALAKMLPRQGITVIRLEQPWRVAGKKVAPAPAILDQCLLAVADQLRTRTHLVLGGRSAGARSACRLAGQLGASGVLALSFPLHPPGKPESSRLEELASVQVPTLVIQGDNDPFGRPEEFPRSTEMAVVPGGDHGLKVPKRGAISQDDALGLVVEAALEWMVREILGTTRKNDSGNDRAAVGV